MINLQKNEAFLSNKFKNSLEEILSGEQGSQSNQTLILEIISEEITRLRLQTLEIHKNQATQCYETKF